MILLDSNIFIYLARGKMDRRTIANTDITHASITEIECLGYWRIQVDELQLLEELFRESDTLPLTEEIVRCATKLRQMQRMSLGDAIIAATALENDCVLWTANTPDFAHIDWLDVFNPLQH